MSSQNTEEILPFPGCHILCELCQRFIDVFLPVGTKWGQEYKPPSPPSDNLFGVQKHKETGKEILVCFHHGQLGVLQKSARSGCHLCSLLVGPDPLSKLNSNENTTTPYVLYLDVSPRRNHGTEICLDVEQWPIYYRSVYSDSRASDSLDFQTPPVPTLRFARTDAKEVLELANSWLQECISKHKECREPGNTGKKFVPTRLIQIQAIGDKIQHVKLSMYHPHQSTRYLALSHCWGGADIIKLIEAKLVEFQDAIPMDRLPKTFQDALAITISLGYNYIWIDSLCIIQDNTEDWKREAEKMGLVYRHADCTIAAAGATDSYGGCFQDRNSLSFTRCRIRPNGPDPLVIGRADQQYPRLYTRGWVVQERCLSPRTLNFGASEISWDCLEIDARETWPMMDGTEDQDTIKKMFSSALRRPSSEHMQSSVVPPWLIFWQDIVRDYTRCDLTKKVDRWPAIHGIASEIIAQLGLPEKSLLHGHWLPHLARDILWYVHKPVQTRLENKSPSWSWLGVDGGVSFSRTAELQYQLVSSTIGITDSQSKTSEVGAGQLHINARFRRVKCTKDSSSGVVKYELEPWNGNGSGKIQSSQPEYTQKPYWAPDIDTEESWETWAMQTHERERPIHQIDSYGIVVVPVPAAEIPTEVQKFYNIDEHDSSGEGVPKDGFWRRIGFCRTHWLRQRGEGIDAFIETPFEKEMSICLI